MRVCRGVFWRGRNENASRSFSARKLVFLNGLPFVDGLSALPKNLADVVDRPSGLPENTQDDTGGFARLPKNLCDDVARLSALAARMPDNIGGRAVLPGNVPDGVDHFSGLPEKMPGNVEHSPRLHEDQPRNVDGFFARRRNAPDQRICRVEGSRRAGDMGGCLAYIARYDFCSPKSEKILGDCRDSKTDPWGRLRFRGLL